jgi:hypothetical protein
MDEEKKRGEVEKAGREGEEIRVGARGKAGWLRKLAVGWATSTGMCESRRARGCEKGTPKQGGGGELHGTSSSPGSSTASRCRAAEQLWGSALVLLLGVGAMGRTGCLS